MEAKQGLRHPDDVAAKTSLAGRQATLSMVAAAKKGGRRTAAELSEEEAKQHASVDAEAAGVGGTEEATETPRVEEERGQVESVEAETGSGEEWRHNGCPSAGGHA